MSDEIDLKFNPEVLTILKREGIPDEATAFLLAGGLYFQHHGGISFEEYWRTSAFSNRDEFFVVLNAYFGLAGVIGKLPHYNEWRLKFDVGFLFQVKSTAQAALSINQLTGSHCYADAFVICRTMISRLNLLVLCALNPNLFDAWLTKEFISKST